MPADIAIVHGWSDTSKSFRNLRDYLRASGYDAVQIWLGDYVSMDDDVRIEDVGKRMHAVLMQAIAEGRLKVPFDLIVHSTGGLVAREWIASFYPDGRSCPCKRLIMLAPANFGSRLAALGKSMIGRVAKGWNNWFQTGRQMLEGLELASPYQWRLATRDLLDPAGAGGGPYGAGKVWPFVIVGTRPYRDGLRQIVNESGSDGTVRVAAANLNAVGMTVDFTAGADRPEVRPWSPRHGGIRLPFAVLTDRDHGSIVDPGAASGDADDSLGRLLLEALGCDGEAAYAAIADAWDARAEAAVSAADDGRHQYMQLVVAVRDDHGRPVDDYFVEFFAPEKAGDKDAVFFHKEVLEHVHANGLEPHRRCFFVDRTDLLERFYPMMRNPAQRQVAISLSAAEAGANVRYFDSTRVGARGHLVVHEADAARRDRLGAERLRRNATHLIEIVVPRQPVEKVFRLS